MFKKSISLFSLVLLLVVCYQPAKTSTTILTTVPFDGEQRSHSIKGLIYNSGFVLLLSLPLQFRSNIYNLLKDLLDQPLVQRAGEPKMNKNI